MRLFGIHALVLAVTLVTGALPADAFSPADGPGCVNVGLADCIGWLRATMKLNESVLTDSLAHRHQTDVNGRPVSGGLVTVNGELPDHNDQFVILLHLRPDDTVVRVESNLLYDLVNADTELLYDHTRLYDIVARLLGRRCAGLNRLDLYRFFQNSVKPRLTQNREDFSGGLSGLHRLIAHAEGVPYCGARFAYTSLLEWRGTKDPRAAARVKRFTYIGLQ